MRRRRYIIQNGVDSPAQLLRYNHGHYTALQHFQADAAVGKDSGAFSIVIGTGSGIATGNYSSAGIPGGHTGTVNSGGQTYGPRNTTGPASTPYTRGIVVPYLWNQLETSQGVYDFSRIDADLATCQALGCQMIIRPETKTFTVGLSPAPAYLDMLPYTGPYSTNGGGVIMSRWDPTVKAAYRALMLALIARYDVNPYVEGITTQETASSLTGPEQAALGYDPTLFYNALLYEVDTITQNATYLRHFAYHNFIPNGNGLLNPQTDALCTQYCQYARDKGSIVGGPDALPFDNGLHNRVYPRYADPNVLYLRCPTFICAQHNEYTDTLNTMEEKFLWSTGQMTINSTKLYVDYFFWDYWYNLSPNNWNPQARDVIAKYYPNTWNSFNY